MQSIVDNLILPFPLLSVMPLSIENKYLTDGSVTYQRMQWSGQFHSIHKLACKLFPRSHCQSMHHIADILLNYPSVDTWPRMYSVITPCLCLRAWIRSSFPPTISQVFGQLTDFPSICQGMFPIIARVTHGNNGLKLGMLTNSDHLQDWLDCCNGWLIF